MTASYTPDPRIGAVATIIMLCKFDRNCSRPSCRFAHPNGRFIDDDEGGGNQCQRGKSSGAPTRTVQVRRECRYGSDCRRVDCYFVHPDRCKRETEAEDGWEEVPIGDKRRHRSRGGVRRAGSAAASSDPLPFVDPPPDFLGIVEPFVLLLCGIPGSGKSTLARTLASSRPWMYIQVNQDSLGHRHACLDLTRRALDSGRIPVIDRCNFNLDQRRYFLEIAKEYKVPVDCIVFQSDVDECISRCRQRGRDHETLKPSEAKEVVERMAREFRPPRNEHRRHRKIESYRCVITVASFRASDQVAAEYLTYANK